MCLPKKKPVLIMEPINDRKCWICGGSIEPHETSHDGCIEIYNRILKLREEILNMEWQLFLKSANI